ncbi:MarR family transcriptional regulator [Clostridium sp. AM58-1XD]|uniref:MarR family winged helix-turn-helix transcriptional regulator n=1 Tax=Clostridium sp. AM58-1XD TaxID=2292307 RepID=UPI001FA8B614|nr:MarR family transcriptional regulator [Clostridium sp. AM58-1XD]
MKNLPIGIRIAQIKFLQSRIFQQLLKKYTDTDLNSAQTNIIFVLWQEDDITISELSQKTNLAKTTLTSMLDRLESSGLLTRLPNPANRRETRICLTERAGSLKAGCLKAFNEMSKINFNGFTDTERESLLSGLDKLYANLSGYNL